LKEALVIAVGIILGLVGLGIGIMNSERFEVVSVDAGHTLIVDKAFGKTCVYGSAGSLPDGYVVDSGSSGEMVWACTPALNQGASGQIAAMFR
jgi:hypothetical protein